MTCLNTVYKEARETKILHIYLEAYLQTSSDISFNANALLYRYGLDMGNIQCSIVRFFNLKTQM